MTLRVVASKDSPKTETAVALFKAGRLTEAVTAAGAELEQAPTDLGARVLLAELLLFTGNMERVGLILDAASDMAPDAAVVIAEFRHLLQAELARRQLYQEGRLPEFLSDPPPAVTAALAAFLALREGDRAEAARAAEVAAAARPRVPGYLERNDTGQGRLAQGKVPGGTLFDDFRDADDLCCSHVDVLTPTGTYFWVPTEQIQSIEFHAPERPRDLFWRRASMVVRNGPDGDVYIPALYVSEALKMTDALRLGRETDWKRESESLIQGVGQRIFLVGDEAISLMALTSLDFGVTPDPS